MAVTRLVVALFVLQNYISFTLCQPGCRTVYIKSTIVRSDLQSITATTNSIPVLFTCESAYHDTQGNTDADWRYICNNYNEFQRSLSNVSVFWEINQRGRYVLTGDLPMEYIQQGITISSYCTHSLNFTELSDTCSMFYQDELDECDYFECRNERIGALLPRCQSNITIPATPADSDTRYRCGTGTVACPNRIDWDGRGRIQIQGRLAAPPDLQMANYNESSSSLVISWNAPFTLPEIPISHYQVKINNFVDSIIVVNVSSNINDQLMLDVNSTSLDIDTIGVFRFIYSPSCESVEFIVSAWNVVGEGETSTVLFSKASLQDVIVYTPDDIQDVICILCVFSNNSQATGCHVRLTQTQSLNSTTAPTTMEFNITRKPTAGFESNINFKLDTFNCVTVTVDQESQLLSGNYTVYTREIECTGGIGNIEFVRSAMINRPAYTPVPGIIMNSRNGAAVKVLASFTAVLLTVVATLLLLLVLGLACVFSKQRRGKVSIHNLERNQNGFDLQQSRGNTTHRDGHISAIYETTGDYDNDTAINRHAYYTSPPTTSHGSEDDRGGWDNSVSEMNQCVAYNAFHKE